MKSARGYDNSNRSDAAASTRDRIASVATTLFIERAFEDVTLAGIAAAAGVSHQTVLNHFESKDGVVVAVAAILAAETTQSRQAVPGDVAGAIAALVGDYERIGDANVRWAVSAHRFPDLAELMNTARAGHQVWLSTIFDASLPASRAARRRAINALHAATDAYTWKLLRRDLGLSRSETEKTIVDLVVGILKGTRP